MSDTTHGLKEATKEQNSPIDLDPAATIVALRTESLHATDVDADVSVVVDGDHLELRIAASLEDVEQLAGRDLFWAEIGAKDLREEKQ